MSRWKKRWKSRLIDRILLDPFWSFALLILFYACRHWAAPLSSTFLLVSMIWGLLDIATSKYFMKQFSCALIELSYEELASVSQNSKDIYLPAFLRHKKLRGVKYFNGKEIIRFGLVFHRSQPNEETSNLWDYVDLSRFSSKKASQWMAIVPKVSNFDWQIPAVSITLVSSWKSNNLIAKWNKYQENNSGSLNPKTIFHLWSKIRRWREFENGK